MAKASDFWNAIDKRNYYEDGTMKPEYRDFLLAEGVEQSRIWAFENLKKRQIEQFQEREERYLRLYGITYSQMTLECGGTVELDY